MANYTRYDLLEKRIKQIKDDMDNLCCVVDQLECVKYSQCQNREDSSTIDSVSSYHTADNDSDSSLCSFNSAVETLENSNDDNNSIKANAPVKKTVSFSNRVTVLQVVNRRYKKRSVSTKITTVKNKLITYIDREKFYLKYKWQKLKDVLSKKSKNYDKSREKPTQHDVPSQEMENILETRKPDESVTQLEDSLNEHISNFMLKINLDEDFKLLSYGHCQPIEPAQSLLKATEEFSKNNSDNQRKEEEIGNRKNSVEPKILSYYENSPKENTFSGDILLKYLITKAQYPSQLKVAQSIVKLNLPLWYQNSLIV